MLPPSTSDGTFYYSTINKWKDGGATIATISLPPKLSFSSTIYHLSPPLKYWFYTTHQQICLNFCLCNVFAPDIALNFRWEKRQQLSALNPNLHSIFLFHEIKICANLNWTAESSQALSSGYFLPKGVPPPHPTLGGKLFCLKRLKEWSHTLIWILDQTQNIFLYSNVFGEVFSPICRGL